MVRARAILPALFLMGTACVHGLPATADTPEPRQAPSPKAEPLVHWLVQSAIPLASTDPDEPIDELVVSQSAWVSPRTARASSFDSSTDCFATWWNGTGSRPWRWR